MDTGTRGRPRAMSMDHDEDMSARDMTRHYHVQTLWIPCAVILLGAWLVSTPFTFGYVDLADALPRVDAITQQRGLPPPATRGVWMTISDVVSGVALMVLGGLALRPGRVLVRWLACGVGTWVLFAPLLLWAPTPAALATGTLVGVLVIALTILVPKMPGMMLVMQPGPTRPPGWSYNPSSWYQRAPMIVLAFIGFFFSRYLGAYQLGFIDWAVDPFFADGTVQVLESNVSRAIPVSDATLGAVAISLEGLMGFMGSESRWRTMPWMVTFFGILVIPLGVAHVVLVILQPVMVGTWCTLCLATAGLMLLMIPLAIDEVVAMSQLVLERRRAGDPFWEVFWKGGTMDGGGDDERSPAYPAAPRRVLAAGIWGVSFPWTLLVSAAIGVWLMASPGVLGTEGAAADSDHLVGALVLVTAVVATAEVVRAGRYLNVVAGAWLVVAHWILPGADTVAQVTTSLAGIALIALSLPRGQVREHYGTADRHIR
jgi:hypothetical protein